MHIIDLQKIRAKCSECSLAEMCLPRGLNQRDMKKLEAITRKSRPVNRGDCIYDAGERFNAIYAVNAGSIKISLLNDAGEEQIIGFYLPGEMFGFDGIDGQTYTCRAIAMETSTLCAFPFTKLNDICHDIPQLQEEVLRILSREISYENQLLITINKKTAEEKTATFLLSLSSRFKRLGYSPYEFKLSMSRQDIGNYLGLTIETVSRILNRFQRAGLITLQHRFVKITSHAALQGICTSHEDSAA